LIIHGQGDDLQASWLDPASGESSRFPLTLPLAPGEMDELR
jgi:hypothetical protein